MQQLAVGNYTGLNGFLKGSSFISTTRQQFKRTIISRYDKVI